jgi:RNA polymerase sigma-70 factor (ECF subfamily)
MWLAWAVVAIQSGSHAADRRALEGMARGDHGALSELYDRHGRLVYSLALRVLRDQGDAEDVVQEVFSQAWRQASRYESTRGPVVAWLMNLARSRAIDRLRSRRARPETGGNDVEADRVLDLAPPIDEQLALSDQAEQIRAAVEQLSLVQRVAIELAFYEGLTHVEIAERLELPLGTVKTRIRQGLSKLKERLAGAVQ